MARASITRDRDPAPRPLRRGDVVLADFSAAPGTPIEKSRPAVVVQNDVGNRYAPMTIIVPVRRDAGKGLPVHVVVARGTGGLDKDSIVDCGILWTVNSRDLGPCLGRLPPNVLAQVDAALKVSLGLR